ncbi:hypothetical protein DNTS_026223 [Danionella cerebrum]|uniref:deoxyguanosine kinase n=1 Tax=Danionella cerebrum TaxID=2873325 RepID=A0A553NLE4_9TELE|nr:hypothetical protein DNTS_026223 [Danionella translucida]
MTGIIQRLLLLSAAHRWARNQSTCAQIKRVSIEGNIAVGKSTFARLLQESNPDWEVITEPVSKWQNVDHETQSQHSSSNLLQMMYEDPKRWSYTFQSFSCLSRLRTQLQPITPMLPQAPKGAVQVYERSVYSDRYVFALNMFKLGFINSVEWAVYQEYHSFLLQQFGHRVELEGIIYLRASPQTCLGRLQKRAREEEQQLELHYLQMLHQRHEDWLLNRTTPVHSAHLLKLPVLVLDTEGEFERNPEVRVHLISKVHLSLDSLTVNSNQKVTDVFASPATGPGFPLWVVTEDHSRFPLLLKMKG